MRTAYLHDIEKLVVDGGLISVDDFNAVEELNGGVKLLLTWVGGMSSSYHATHAHTGHSWVRHLSFSPSRFRFYKVRADLAPSTRLQARKRLLNVVPESIPLSSALLTRFALSHAFSLTLGPC